MNNNHNGTPLPGNDTATSFSGFDAQPNGSYETPAANTLGTDSYEKIAWQILVDGKAIQRIISFSLDQSFNSHHRFELHVYHTELENQRTYRIDKSKDLLGKNITVVLGTHRNSDITRFSGIITELSFEERNGLYGELILKGYSPTILLENGPNLHSFYNKNLSSIVRETTQSVSGKIDLKVAPRYTGNIEYTAQNNESHFAFLNRLSAFHGEWFYYDGERLHFGKPAAQPSQELQYARHVLHLRMNMQLLPMNFNQIGYNSSDDQSLQQQPVPKVPGLNYYGDVAVQKSDELFAPAKHRPWQHVTAQSDLDRIGKVNKSARAAQTFSVEGSSKHPSPRPGMRLKIKMGAEEMGEYLVTETTHYLDNTNNYSCSFRALPADVEVQPVREEAVRSLPASEPQVATVKRNDDPTGQGRVRVQFQWQDGDNMSPWMRVMTPDGGGGGKVSKNRGFVFVPEIGDQVMVAFEQGNPDAPFVMGSIFHGKTGGGGGTGNKTKSLTTRSGSTVTLDDDSGSVTVSDPSGNTVVLNGDGTMTINAPNKLEINSKEIIITAEQKLEMSGKDKVGIVSETMVDVYSNTDMNIMANNNLQSVATTKLSMLSPSTVEIVGKQTGITGVAAMKMEGTLVDVKGVTVTNVNGTTLNLNC